MKYINPIEKNPPIKTYLHYALPLSIICAHDYIENVYNVFVQLIYAPEDICPFDFHELNYQSLNFLRVEKYFCYKYEFKQIINEIKKNIRKGFYYIFWTDCFYVPNEKNYKIKHAPHGFLVYGYDSLKDIFYGLGYKQDDGQYGDIYIHSQELYKSIISSKSDFFQKISFAEDYWPGFYISNIEEKYRFYLKSESYDLDDFKFHPKRLIKFYGLSASKEFANHIFNQMNNKENIDPTGIGIFIEHKLFFCKRTKLMVKELDNKRNLLNKLDYLNQIEKNANDIKLLFVRYSLTKKEKIANVIFNKMQLIHQMEESVLNIITNVVD